MAGQDTKIDVILRLQDIATKELKAFAKQSQKSGKKSEKAFKGVQRAIKKTAVSIAALATGAIGLFASLKAGKSIVGAGLGFVDAASDAEEALSKFNVVFGDEARRVEGHIDGMAASAGRSRFEIIKFTGSLQDMFVPLGFVRDEAADLSLAMTQLAIDVASFSNRADADVIRDFTGAFSGSLETVKKYGVVINQAKIRSQALASGLIGLGDELDDVSKTMAIAQLIFKGTSDAQGDAARTAGSWANTMKSLKAQIDKIRVEVGAFVRDELLLLINSFGTAEEIGQKLTRSFALVGVATVGIARLLAALGRAALDALDSFGGLGGAVNLVAQFGITVEHVVRKLIAQIPKALEVINGAIKKLQLGLLLLKLDIIRVVNEFNDSFFGSGATVNVDPTLEAIAAVRWEIALSTLAVAAENRELQKTYKELAAEEKAARERAKEFTDSLNQTSDGVETLEERLGRLITKKGGLLDFFKGLTERVAATKNEIVGLTGAMGAMAKLAATAGLNAGVSGAEAQAFNDAALPGAVVDREQQDAAEAQRDALREQADAAKAVWQETEKQSSAWMGAQEAVDQYAASMSDFALTKDLVGGLFQTLESGLGQFSRDLVEGEANFKEFAQNTIKQIGAMVIQFLLLKAVRAGLGVGESGDTTGGGLLGALGFAKGGVMQGSMGTPVNAYANGGVANSPQLAVFGEGRGAEAFVPLPDGKRIPVAMEGGGGGGTNVTIQISAIDSQSGMEFLDKHAGRIGTNVANQIEAGMNRKLVKAVGR
tara:strand:- start:1037 stop:3343 length:2307 start_codon:yes stop_codon:yes gene_type:complete